MLVTLKNQIVKLLQGDNSRDEINHIDSLIDSNYGSIADRGQQISDEELRVSISRKSNVEDEEDEGFFSSFDPRVMSDVIIGLSDGLTVPFALTAGLSSLGDSKLVITGGLAELVSGAISMGLGGYLAAKSESEYYFNQVKKEKMNFFKKPELVNQEAAEVLFELGISETNILNILKDFDSKPKNLIEFVITYGKGLDEPAEGREFTSALTIGLAYFLGGFVPLVPYFFCSLVKVGLLVSVIVMMVTLFIFGYVKTMISLGDCGTWKKVSEGVQMVIVGSIAAGAAWTLVFFIDN
ncbi:Protein ccc1 [Yamadazyma tenuis]|uniref:DUF125-domain-containing protein n=1 Tax=Candida tenuis (strain ATCC 10573 / BCRC 21748 / CBS 615 / JCM 9827 / NBRC 10315 / NRRL Y-1498 / VKM Y-70) TaxID=590646 RepID=G3B810_CANTC|nr:DUF125-domain-containing protein [Yamadazyma tenuis ATCC 10573]EGV62329.1 DUF125-domain-containing protein [Yamadazyma tenuis ATCC 10573]WEJ93588.1 Protein ccc1 [Yamadazyma tenuis]